MGDLGEGEQEEEGGGAGLGMGDVLGGVVTFDVTVGGASGEREIGVTQIQQKHKSDSYKIQRLRFLTLMLPVASGMCNISTCTFNYYFIHLLLHSALRLCTCVYLTLL